MSVIDLIRAGQKKISPDTKGLVPEHKPEMLLIGCIDARVNPIEGLGIPNGKTLIHRNPAALVRKSSDNDSEVGNRAISATLDFAVDVMKVKDIVVMGHTYCGGIRACLCPDDFTHLPNLQGYLKSLDNARAQVVAAGGDIDQQARAMEQEAVRQSLENLMTYNVVKKAVNSGSVKLCGWVIDITNNRLSEFNPKTGKFEPLGV